MLYEMLLLLLYTFFIHLELLETLIILGLANVVKWRFLKSLEVQEHCTKGVVTITHTIASVMLT